jgi:pre-mRNA-splicing factor SYF2
MESAEKVVVDTVELVQEKVAEVVEAAEEFVQEMTGIEESSGKSGDATPADSTAEPTQRMTMEERKAKLAELRKKMVCFNTTSGFKFCVDEALNI